MTGKNRFCLYGVLLAAFLLLGGCSTQPQPQARTGFYFDTSVTVTLYPADGLSDEKTDALFHDCFALCETYENMFSRTKEGSDIWRINHAQGAPVQVSAETAALLQQALLYCEKTEGAVDITIAPLSDLWDFSSEHPEHTSRTPPAPSQIAERLSHVDYRNVTVSGDTVTLSDPQAALDLGCIAKGYIADQIKACLQEQGVHSAIINLGGNVLTLGNKPDGSPFRLGIQKPFDVRNTPIASLAVTDASLVSSGVYERYFEADGIRYHHLLNTRTGMPENNTLLSVTILSDSSAQGDILSTACFLLGLQGGMDFVESLPGVEAVFITEDYELHPSSGLSDLVQKR